MGGWEGSVELRCVLSFRRHSPGKYWHFPPKLPKNGPVISKPTVGWRRGRRGSPTVGNTDAWCVVPFDANLSRLNATCCVTRRPPRPVQTTCNIHTVLFGELQQPPLDADGLGFAVSDGRAGSAVWGPSGENRLSGCGFLIISSNTASSAMSSRPVPTVSKVSHTICK